MKSCKKKTTWGRCAQRAIEDGLCSAHLMWAQLGTTPDRYYEEKVVRGLVTPTWDWMSESEANALIHGRNRGDGRRLDQWTIEEGPMEIDKERFR